MGEAVILDAMLKKHTCAKRKIEDIFFIKKRSNKYNHLLLILVQSKAYVLQEILNPGKHGNFYLLNFNSTGF